jgi:hypothetical protein
MSDLANVLPVLGAIVLGGLVVGQLLKPGAAPVPVRAKKPRRR